jgi:hypothetical protein
MINAAGLDENVGGLTILDVDCHIAASVIRYELSATEDHAISDLDAQSLVNCACLSSNSNV